MATTNVAFDMQSPFSVSGLTGEHSDLGPSLNAPPPMRPIPVGVDWNTGSGGRRLQPVNKATDTGGGGMIPSNPPVISTAPVTTPDNGSPSDGGSPNGGGDTGGSNTPIDDSPIDKIIGLIQGQQSSGGGGGTVAIPATVSTGGSGSGSGMIVVLVVLAGIGAFIFFNRKKKAEA